VAEVAHTHIIEADNVAQLSLIEEAALHDQEAAKVLDARNLIMAMQHVPCALCHNATEPLDLSFIVVQILSDGETVTIPFCWPCAPEASSDAETEQLVHRLLTLIGKEDAG